jgi:hypothetical protein
MDLQVLLLISTYRTLQQVALGLSREVSLLQPRSWLSVGAVAVRVAVALDMAAAVVVEVSLGRFFYYQACPELYRLLSVLVEHLFMQIMRLAILAEQQVLVLTYRHTVAAVVGD